MKTVNCLSVLFILLFLSVVLTTAYPQEKNSHMAKVSNGKVDDSVHSNHANDSIKNGFPGLKMYQSKNSMAFLAYNPEVTKVIDKELGELEKTHLLFPLKDTLFEEDVLVLETKIDRKDDESYYVVYSEFPSGDPHFCFVKVGGPLDYWNDISGTAIAIPANGFIYGASRYDANFTERRKYKYDKAGFHEVQQPYYYVGLKTRTVVPIILYSDQKTNQQIAELPSGTEIEVLLTDNKRVFEKGICYLVKTPFGLLGWVWVEEKQLQADVIEGISYWGD